MMLTEQEKGFIAWWEENRLKKKKIRQNLSVGLPMGVALASAMLINIYSGWNLAGTMLEHNGTLFLTVIIAILSVVAFIVVFSARHRWDMNEQHYKELIAKKDKP